MSFEDVKYDSDWNTWRVLNNNSWTSLSGILLNAILSSLPYNYITDHVFELVDQIIKCQETAFPVFYLLKNLGMKLLWGSGTNCCTGCIQFYFQFKFSTFLARYFSRSHKYLQQPFFFNTLSCCSKECDIVITLVPTIHFVLFLRGRHPEII